MEARFWVLTVLTLLIQLSNAQMACLRKTSTRKLNRRNWVPKPHARVHGPNTCPSTDQDSRPTGGHAGGAVGGHALPAAYAVHDTEAQGRKHRRKRMPASSRDLVQHLLLVAQAKHNNSSFSMPLPLPKPAKWTTAWIYMPRIDQVCPALIPRLCFA